MGVHIKDIIQYMPSLLWIPHYLYAGEIRWNYIVSSQRGKETDSALETDSAQQHKFNSSLSEDIRKQKSRERYFNKLEIRQLTLKQILPAFPDFW